MPRRPISERALTDAERQARYRARKASQRHPTRAMLEQIMAAETIAEAHKIAAAALAAITPRPS